ncbi:hypothetical protein TDB9533_03706 [Thalassocella blandensis]|nr:hypothetical protein TDB9533_03706 [Thalassocella blandensis]
MAALENTRVVGMKSKIRNIFVKDREFTWSITEIDWDKVLLKIWISGHKRNPWITINRDFHNPWYLIGQVKEENIDNLKLNPITPKNVASIIELALVEFGEPKEGFKQMHVAFNDLGKLVKC